MSLTHEAFRKRQTSAELSGLSYRPLSVAWTDIGKGDPVILLHGIPTWSYLYNDVIPLLGPHFRVLAPDFLGHGYSDRRDFFDRSLLAQTAMIIRLMDHLEIERARAAQHLVEDHSEREDVRAWVDRRVRKELLGRHVERRAAHRVVELRRLETWTDRDRIS